MPNEPKSDADILSELLGSQEPDAGDNSEQGQEKPNEEARQENKPTHKADVLEVAGRKFAPHELAKAYENLLRDYTKKAQALAALKQGGQEQAKPSNKPSDAEKGKTAGGDETASYLALKQMMDKMVELERWREDKELEEEERALVAKYKLSNADLRGVYRICYEFGGIPLEQAYEIYEYRKEKAKKAGPPKAPHIDSTSSRGSDNSGASYMEKVRQILRDAGYR